MREITEGKWKPIKGKTFARQEKVGNKNVNIPGT